jgi:hypothetical protein
MTLHYSTVWSRYQPTPIEFHYSNTPHQCDAPSEEPGEAQLPTALHTKEETGL